MDEYSKIVADCAEQGRGLARILADEGISEALYLYGRRSEAGKGPGKLMLVRDSAPVPQGTELVTGEGLRVSVPYHKYFQWIHDRAKRFPCLSWEEKASA